MEKEGLICNEQDEKEGVCVKNKMEKDRSNMKRTRQIRKGLKC